LAAGFAISDIDMIDNSDTVIGEDVSDDAFDVDF
jgi:hypothetical protein